MTWELLLETILGVSSKMDGTFPRVSVTGQLSMALDKDEDGEIVKVTVEVLGGKESFREEGAEG